MELVSFYGWKHVFLFKKLLQYFLKHEYKAKTIKQKYKEKNKFMKQLPLLSISEDKARGGQGVDNLKAYPL